jgi:hypothetical protein
MPRDARDLAGGLGSGDPDANGNPFWVFMFACVRLTGIGRVQEESSAPQPRLAFIHLQSSFRAFCSITRQSSSTFSAASKKKRRDRVKKSVEDRENVERRCQLRRPNAQ